MEDQSKRIADILNSLRNEVERYNGEDPSRFGAIVAELGANLCDAANGRDAYAQGRTPIGTLSYGARGSTTRKVRKALGYTYP